MARFSYRIIGLSFLGDAETMIKEVLHACTMKAKKIPVSVRFWLILLGIWAGTVATMILMTLWIQGIDIAIPILIAYFIVVWGLWYALGKKYANALEEWGVTTPKKEKGKQ